METYKIVLMALLGAAVIGSTIYTMNRTPNLEVGWIGENKEILNAWAAWSLKFNKKYDNNEALYRYAIYALNYRLIKLHPKESTYTVAEN
jgi:hypothetical protein